MVRKFMLLCEMVAQTRLSCTVSNLCWVFRFRDFDEETEEISQQSLLPGVKYA